MTHTYTHIQTQPVSLTVYAQVTSSDIEFSTPNLDFGNCTVHESVVATIHLTNKSILPQQFGFINLPEVRILSLSPGQWLALHNTLPAL